jgi:hypothetical protein
LEKKEQNKARIHQNIKEAPSSKIDKKQKE